MEIKGKIKRSVTGCGTEVNKALTSEGFMGIMTRANSAVAYKFFMTAFLTSSIVSNCKKLLCLDELRLQGTLPLQASLLIDLQDAVLCHGQFLQPWGFGDTLGVPEVL